MKKKEKLIPETESVIPEAESAQNVAPEAAVSEPVVTEAPQAAAEPVAEPVAEETPVAAEAESSAEVLDAPADEPVAADEAAAEGEAVATEEGEPVAENEDSNKARGKKKKERAPKQPKAPKEPKKRKSKKGLIISLVAIVLVCGILAGGYFLGLLDGVIYTVFNKNTPLDKYFVVDEKTAAYTKVDRFDGEVIAYDEEHALVAVRSESVNTSNYRNVSITVYDANTGKQLTVMSDSRMTDQRPTDFDVNFSNYPLVLTTETSWYEDSVSGWTANYYYRTGMISVDEEGREYDSLFSGLEQVTDVKELKNGLVSFADEDYVYYYSKDGNFLRKELALYADTYTTSVEYDAEWNGNLYAWEFDDDGADRKVQVYNTDGVCVAQYNFNGYTLMEPTVVVLANGNVFIQEVRMTEDSDYEAVMGLYRTKTYSMIMDAKTGEITDLDLDFTVESMESGYVGAETDMFFALKDDSYNQAVIAKRGYNGNADYAYVVLDNEMKIVMDAVALTYNDDALLAFGSDRYIVASSGLGDTRFDVFNLKNGFEFTVPENYRFRTEDLFVTSTAIYNKDGKKIFNFGKDDLTKGKEYELVETSSNVYLEITNQITDAEEVYLFNEKSKAFKQIADGKNTSVDLNNDVADEYYVVCDENLEVYSLYNAKGKVVLKTQNDMDLTALDGALLVKTSINGKPVCYVIHG